MSTLLRDLRYALRTFGANPSGSNWGFAVAAILSLAIGIGANTSIFSVTNALLFRPLPYKDADRLVILWNRSPGLNISQDWFSTAQFFDIKNGHQGFEQLAVAIGGVNNLTGYGEPERVGVIRVSSNLLPMLGVRPASGRLFVAEEDAAGRAATAILTYGMWERRYGRDPKMIGKKITLNGEPLEVVGVLPRGFSLPYEVLPILNGAEVPEILTPLPLGPAAVTSRNHEDYNVIGKLKRGVSVKQAQAEMETITAALRRDHPDLYPPNGGLTFAIVPLLEQVVGDVRKPLLILLGAVGFVLLIACANVANLLLARAVARQKEIAVRFALGASRSRIVRQLLTESVLLALCGGALGVVLSFWSIHWIQVLGPKSLPRLNGVGIDGEVLLFTFFISLLSGVLFGLAPAARASRLSLHDALKDASRGSAGASAVWGRGRSTRTLLVVSELALSVVLLIGAGLLIRSFATLQDVSPGFNPRGVLTLSLAMSGRKYNPPTVLLETYRQLWERLEQLPGVAAAGGISSLPLTEMFAWAPWTVEGRVPAAGENFLIVDERIVAGHYFQTMEIPLRSGRAFNEQDTAANPRVGIVDEFTARQMWPNQDPLGKRVHWGALNSNSPWITIVGVVGRVKAYALDEEPRIVIYVPHTQVLIRAMNLVVRSNVDAAALTSAVNQQIHGLDADLPIYYVRTMQQRVDESLARRRFLVTMLALFAGVALVLATIGIYGVMAYLVSQGSREIGIRLALGATQGGILRMVVSRGMMVAVAGVGVGLAAAFFLTRLMRSLLFGVDTADPLTFVAIAGLLGFVALAASFIPARRAARIDPMDSLRCD